MVQGLLELGSGWWIIVGVLSDREPRSAVMFLHYDPTGEVPDGGRSATVVLTRSEALRLSTELTHVARALPDRTE